MRIRKFLAKLQSIGKIEKVVHKVYTDRFMTLTEPTLACRFSLPKEQSRSNHRL